MDTQKDTWIYEFSTVSLDPLQTGNLTTISPIDSVSINNGKIVLDGYLDIGLYDTMEDLFVTFVGAVAFNIFAAVYAKKASGLHLGANHWSQRTNKTQYGGNDK